MLIYLLLNLKFSLQSTQEYYSGRRIQANNIFVLFHVADPIVRVRIGIDFRYIDNYLECCLSWEIFELDDGDLIFKGLPNDAARVYEFKNSH